MFLAKLFISYGHFDILLLLPHGVEEVVSALEVRPRVVYHCVVHHLAHSEPYIGRVIHLQPHCSICIERESQVKFIFKRIGR